jgi:N-acetyl-gamma-glutamyl-phosphate reductase
MPEAMKKIRAGIIGGAGYTGGELIRLLLLHPQAEIISVQSTSSVGKKIYEVHTDLLGETDLVFTESFSVEVDVLFLCGGHDAARKFMLDNKLPAGLVLIDLSQDFRHRENNIAGDRTFIYGLPELNRDKIKIAKSIANPGCFATSIELALLPLASVNELHGDIHINATTGSTGAGQALSATTHFSWRAGNLSVYKPFTHQHIREIAESLNTLQSSLACDFIFVPQRGNFTRGILAAVQFKSDRPLAELYQLYQSYYAAHPFVTVSDTETDLKQVVNTNRCFLHIDKHKDNVLITSVIDNLLKGASGQAVQNMNIIFGLDERAGLHLKPSAF